MPKPNNKVAFFAFRALKHNTMLEWDDNMPRHWPFIQMIFVAQRQLPMLAAYLYYLQGRMQLYSMYWYASIAQNWNNPDVLSMSSGFICHRFIIIWADVACNNSRPPWFRSTGPRLRINLRGANKNCKHQNQIQLQAPKQAPSALKPTPTNDKKTMHISIVIKWSFLSHHVFFSFCCLVHFWRSCHRLRTSVACSANLTAHISQHSPLLIKYRGSCYSTLRHVPSYSM